MAADRTLALGVDSRGAVRGYKRAERSADRFTRSARGSVRQTDQLNNSFDRAVATARRFATALASLAAVRFLQKRITDAVMLAARYETLGIVVETVGRNAGRTAAEMATFEQGLRESGIAAVEARQALARMVQANIDLARSSDLARIAQNAAVIANTNSSDAFERLVIGIQTAQVRILRTIGLNVDFAASYRDLASELGKTVEELSEAEKMQARVNTVVEAGAQITGTYEAAMETAGKRLGSLTRLVADFAVDFGTNFLGTFTVAIDTVSAGFIAARKHADLLADAVASLVIVMGTAAGVGLAWAVSQVAVNFSGAVVAFFQLTTAVRSLAGALALLQVAMGPVGWLVAGVTAVAGAVFAWRRRQREMNDELAETNDLLKKQEPLVRNIAEQVGEGVTVTVEQTSAAVRSTRTLQRAVAELGQEWKLTGRDFKTDGMQFVEALGVLKESLEGINDELRLMAARAMGTLEVTTGVVRQGLRTVGRQPATGMPDPAAGGGDGFMDKLEGAAEKAGGVLKSMGKSVLGVLKALNPWKLILDALSHALGDFLRNMTPIVELIGKALMPIFKALFPIIKMVTVAATYLGQVLFNVAGGISKAIGFAIRTIGKALNLIPFVSPGDPLVRAGQSMMDLADGFFEAAGELATARDEIKALEWTEAADNVSALGDAAAETAEALLNAPSGFKIALERFRASDPTFRLPPSPNEPNSGTDFTLANRGAGGVSLAGSSNENIEVRVTIEAPDGRQLFEVVDVEARRAQSRGGNTSLTQRPTLRRR